MMGPRAVKASITHLTATSTCDILSVVIVEDKINVLRRCINVLSLLMLMLGSRRRALMLDIYQRKEDGDDGDDSIAVMRESVNRMCWQMVARKSPV
jgi:hypothetical protein